MLDFIKNTLAARLDRRFWAKAAAQSSQEESEVKALIGVESQHSTIKVKGPERGIAQTLGLQLSRRVEPGELGDVGILVAYHTVPMFHAAMRIVADSFARVPWWVEINGERVDDHPLARLLAQPSPEHSGYEWRWLQVHYRKLLGESIDWIQQMPGGEYSLLPFPKTSCRREYPWWEIRHNELDVRVHEDEILRIFNPSLLDPYGRGVGAGMALAGEVDLSRLAQKHERTEFANFGVPLFMMLMPGATSLQAADVADKWAEEVYGVDNRGRAMFLPTPEGLAPIIQEAHTKLKDMAVTEVREFSDKLIRKTLGVQPELLGEMESSNRATSEHAMTQFAEHVLEPLLEQHRLGLTRQLLPLFNDDRLTIKHGDPRPDPWARREEVMGSRFWAFTINEHRAQAGYDAIPDGNALVIPNNTTLHPVGAPAEEGPDDERDFDYVVELETYRKAKEVA